MRTESNSSTRFVEPSIMSRIEDAQTQPVVVAQLLVASFLQPFADLVSITIVTSLEFSSGSGRLYSRSGSTRDPRPNIISFGVQPAVS